MASLPERDATKKQEVFYNPLMKSNRNLSILLLNCLDKKEMKIADPLAGSGIRSLRFLRELKKDKIKEIYINDFKEDFVKVFEKNLNINKIKRKNKIQLRNQEASLFLLGEKGFDYIEVDPFGSPNPFLASAIARISRGGILAVTATDTAALTGTYPKVTKRKYWATSLKNYLMHEIGLRILIRKVQLQGIQFDKAPIPILSYHKDHYFRVYFVSEKGKEVCDGIIRQHQYLLFCHHCLNFRVSKYNLGDCECNSKFNFAGPLWTGKLFDQELIKRMVENNPYLEEQKFLDLLREESKMDIVGFYDLHELARVCKRNPPKMETTLKKLKAVRTHFSPNGVKTKKGMKEVITFLTQG